MTLCFRMNMGDLLVFKSRFLCENGEHVWIKRWFVVCRKDFRYPISWENLFQFPSCYCPNEVVQVTNSTSEYLEYWSFTTKVYSSFRNGPQRSSCKIAHGLDGGSVIFAGSVCLVSVATCHLKHLFTAVSMFWNSFNNVSFFSEIVSNDSSMVRSSTLPGLHHLSSVRLCWFLFCQA